MKIVNCKLKIVFLSILFLLPLLTFAFIVPEKPTNFVSDYAGMLTSDEKTALENKISQFEKQTTNEIAVVTVPSLDGEPVENLAQEIFTKWGIGKKDKNNGVLLLISLSDRKTRIQTGYGVEGDLTDIGTSYIQSDIITPAFRNGKYADGINGAVDAMITALGGANIVPENYNTQTNKIPSNINWNLVFIVIFIFFQWTTAIFARSKSWWGGGVFGGIVALLIWHFFISSVFLAIPLVALLIGIGLLIDFIVSRSYQKHKEAGKNMPWFLGGGPSSGGWGGGGGFGGFGGGGSGGGGSSGSW